RQPLQFGPQRNREVVHRREQCQVPVQRCHSWPQARARPELPIRRELHLVVRQGGRRQRARSFHVPLRAGGFTREGIQLERSRPTTSAQRLVLGQGGGVLREQSRELLLGAASVRAVRGRKRREQAARV